jgi:hypothetical protein
VLIRRIVEAAETRAQQEQSGTGTGTPGRARTLTLLQVLRAHDSVLAEQGAADAHTTELAALGGYHRLFLKMALDPEPNWHVKAARMEQVRPSHAMPCCLCVCVC